MEYIFIPVVLPLIEPVGNRDGDFKLSKLLVYMFLKIELVRIFPTHFLRLEKSVRQK